MISATIITLNEGDRIEKALQNVLGVADEIIVLDCGSSDKTVERAKQAGAKIYFRKFDNFSNQKNYAVSKTSGDWILSLDADEEIPQALASEIRNAVKTNDYDGYLIPRRNFILGKEIKHSRWSPDTHIWLWKKNFGKWTGDVHEEVVIKGKVGKLKNTKIHYQKETISEFIKSNDFYANLLAKSLRKKGTKFTFFKLLWDSISEFFIRFFYKLGFLDGLIGFILAYLMAIYKISVWIKIYELQNFKHHQNE